MDKFIIKSPLLQSREVLWNMEWVFRFQGREGNFFFHFESKPRLWDHIHYQIMLVIFNRSYFRPIPHWSVFKEYNSLDQNEWNYFGQLTFPTKCTVPLDVFLIMIPLQDLTTLMEPKVCYANFVNIFKKPSF